MVYYLFVVTFFTGGITAWYVSTGITSTLGIYQSYQNLALDWHMPFGFQREGEYTGF